MRWKAAFRLIAGSTALVAAAFPTLPLAQQPAAGAVLGDADFTFTLLTKRTAECGFLAPWEEEVVYARNDWLMRNLTEEERLSLNATIYLYAVAMRLTPCSDPGFARWIWATRAFGVFLIEYLPPHLLLFRSLATMETRTEQFLEAAGGIDIDATVAAVDAALGVFREERLTSMMRGLSQDLAEDGVTIEGAGDARMIADGLATFLTAIAAGNVHNDALSQASALRFMDDIAIVVALWVAGGCPIGVSEPEGMPETMPPHVGYVGVPDCPGGPVVMPPDPPPIPAEDLFGGSPDDVFGDLPPSPALEAPQQVPEGGVLNLLERDGD